MTRPSVVVIDAGVAILQAVADPLSERVDELWTHWIQEGFLICAPQLWLNEVTSALHKIYRQNLITEEQAQQALEALLGLNVELYEANADACRQAFSWATRLDHFQAYDGFYLALAESLQAPLWTTDRRLVNRVRQLDINWTHWVGE